MMNHRRNSVFLLAVIVAFAALAGISCSGKPEKLVAPEDTGQSTKERMKSAKLAQELEGVKYSQTKDGKLQWELTANRVHQVADAPTQLQGVKLTYYAEDGRVVTLTADSGTYEDATRNVTLQGNVVVNTSDGNHVDTDAIAWNQKSGILKGKGEVRITRGDSIIRGKGFDLSPENETVNIYNVTGVIHKKEMNL